MLRRGAFQFLTRYGVAAWETTFAGMSWQIRLPPDVEALPVHRRYRAHVRQEARRLAAARLYEVCPRSTQQVLELAQGWHRGAHPGAVSAWGRGGVVETLGIEPPSPSGFVRWGAGIGRNEWGVPYLACHWGTAARGARWLVWWSDSHTLARIYAARTPAHLTGARHVLDTGFVKTFGSLWYDRQQLLTPVTGQPPDPRLAAGEAPAHSPDGEGAATSDAELIYTTLATWWLLNLPGSDLCLTHEQPAPPERAADLLAGLTPGPITHLSVGAPPMRQP
jgi:hypothetical protein